jgi:hypothetical protein
MATAQILSSQMCEARRIARAETAFLEWTLRIESGMSCNEIFEQLPKLYHWANREKDLY